MRFQHTLPNLPVPPLQQTMDKYLRVVGPLLNHGEMEKTRKYVEEFRKSGGTGEVLQNLLERRAKERTNWVIANRQNAKA